MSEECRHHWVLAPAWEAREGVVRARCRRCGATATFCARLLEVPREDSVAVDLARQRQEGRRPWL